MKLITRFHLVQRSANVICASNLPASSWQRSTENTHSNFRHASTYQGEFPHHYTYSASEPYKLWNVSKLLVNAISQEQDTTAANPSPFLLHSVLISTLTVRDSHQMCTIHCNTNYSLIRNGGQFSVVTTRIYVQAITNVRLIKLFTCRSMTVKYKTRSSWGSSDGTECSGPRSCAPRHDRNFPAPTPATAALSD